MRGWLRVSFAITWMAMLPAALYAQGSIAGSVKDTSGAVLPGVTVEASSPALIEKTRSVVTDGTGQYKIVDLRPGTYVVTFTLPGFAAVKREGIELTGAFTATVNADMRVGAVEETVTVTGETPIVDIQNTLKERSLTRDVIDAIPTGRLAQNLAVLLPGVTIQGGVPPNGMTPQDVGGSSGNTVSRLTVHGSSGYDQMILLNGQSVMLTAGTHNTPYVANMGSTQEVTIDTSGISAESMEGGIRMNIIPKEGGNTYHGSMFGAFANEAMANSNFTDDLKNRGFLTPNTIKTVADVNPAFGGPIKKDSLWFFTSYRLQIANNYPGGMFYDTTWNDPTVFKLNLDPNQRVSNDGMWNEGNVRLTWQATSKNKFGFSFTKDHMCTCPANIRATGSPGDDQHWGWPHHFETVEWTSPLTNRLLIEAGFFHQLQHWLWVPLEGSSPELIGFVDQATNTAGKLFRGGNADRWQHDTRYRAALSYITGAHAMKVGFSNGTGDMDATLFWMKNNYTYRVNINPTTGVSAPNLITEFAAPYHDMWQMDRNLGIYAQDKWTFKRLTANGGIRLDMYKSSFPALDYGPIQLAPTRNFSLPEQPNADWKDVTPRAGMAYDLLGNGKTAIKVSLNKYLVTADGPAFTLGALPPYNRVVYSTTRTWTDANSNFIPDCDLTGLGAQDLRTTGGDFCGALADPNFGKAVVSTAYDPNAVTGWGKRPFNWEFATSVQQQILPRVSIDAGYFRRWYGNFGITDNLALSAADFDQFCATAPVDSRSPNGGGNQICGLYNVKQERFTVAPQNLVTLSSNYGNQIQHWNGGDVSVNARLSRGVTLQAGVSAGRASFDNCEVVAKVPELIANATTAMSASYCHVNSPVLVDGKAVASYQVPRIDVQVAGSFQSSPGPYLIDNWPAPVTATTLGRAFAGNAPNVTVNLIPTASQGIGTGNAGNLASTMYGERLNQLDLRFSKILRFGALRVAANLDIYNVTNANTVLTESQTFANWRTPQSILIGRFFKVGAQLDF